MLPASRRFDAVLLFALFFGPLPVAGLDQIVVASAAGESSSVAGAGNRGKTSPTGTTHLAADRRLHYQVARLALDRRERPLARWILQTLARNAGSEAERQLFRARASEVDGTAARRAEAARAALAAVAEEGGETPEWVRREILTLAAELRLEELRQRARDGLEYVLVRHSRALGGPERLAELDSWVATGTVSAGDAELPFRMFRARPGFYRFELGTPAGTRLEVADPQAAWRSDPARDGGRPRYLAGAEGATLQRGAHLFGPLVRHRSTGERLFYRGLEAVDEGEEAHVVEVTSPEGSRELLYLSSETFLVNRIVALGPGGSPRNETLLEHREVDGLRLPARQTVRGPAGTLVFEFTSYRLNAEIDAALFDIADGAPGFHEKR